MLYEFPKALALVLVDDRDPSFFGFLDRGAVLDVLPPLVALGQRVQFLVLVEVDVLVIFCEIHVAIGVDVIDEQLIVEVDIVSVVLVRPVGIDLPHDLRVRLRTHLYREGTVAGICGFVQSSEEGVAFHMSEDGLSAV